MKSTSLPGEIKIPSRIDRIKLVRHPGHEHIFLKRDDLIHPYISGNKWRKLAGYIERARAFQKGIWTCGGAYSNHLLATAFACKIRGLKAGAYVRGKELNAKSNEVVRRCEAMGMQLEFISRERYGQLANGADVPGFLYVPEGGFGPLAQKGFEEAIKEVEGVFDCMVCPVGSGGTLGSLASVNQRELKAKKVIGISAVGNGAYLREKIRSVWPDASFILRTEFAGKGFGKITPDLIAYARAFYQLNEILPDPLYTVKMLIAVEEMIGSGELAASDKILLWHTGGLTGWWGAGSTPWLDAALEKLEINPSRPEGA